MALQLWLPLNKEGDFRNKGLTDSTITNVGATYDSNGKIGGCYNFTTGNYIEIDSANINKYKFSNNLSVSCWVYINSYTDSCLINCLETGGFALYLLDDVKKIRWQIYANNDYRYKYGSTILNLQTWYHICGTFDGRYSTLYINGIVESIYDLGAQYPITYNATTPLEIGGNPSPNSFASGNFIGKVNDIRIYDHCLSPYEVKEISKGLVLHYPLNQNPAININNLSLDYSNYNIWNYRNRTSGIISNGIYHCDGYLSNSSIDTSFILVSTNYISLEANTTYYLSFNCKVANSLHDIFFYYLGNSTSVRTALIDKNDTWYYPSNRIDLGKNYEGWISLAINTGDSDLYKIAIGLDDPNLYGIGSYFECNNIMVSKIKPDYYKSYNDNIIYDVSGYENHGNIIDNLYSEKDSPKYDKYTTFNTESYFTCKNLFSNFIFNEISISYWIKLSDITTKTTNIYLGNSDYHLYTDFNALPYRTGIRWAFYKDDGTIVYNHSATGTNTPAIANVWYHLVYTFNKGVIKHYVNSQVVETSNRTATATKAILSGDVVIGKFNGNMSDVRIYFTALSESDIKDLYQTSVSILDNKNIECYLFKELSNNICRSEYFLETGRLTYGIGEIVDRNGEKAMYFLPNSMWYATETYGAYTTTTNLTKRHLSKYFKENTLYKFDLWIDVDDHVDSSGNNYSTGISIYYTDGTSDYIINALGNKTNPIGFLHIVCYSNSSKTVRGLYVRYNYNRPTYIRCDSLIVPVESNTNMNKQGIIESGQFRENQEDFSILKGSYIDTNKIKEI